MTKKNKSHIPKNMGDLERIYYGGNKDGTSINYKLIRKHQDWLRTERLSPSNEKEVIDIFSPVGTVVKISENPNEKTADFKIDDEKILIEVTSLDFGIEAQITVTENKILSKIQESIAHIIEKDTKYLQNYYKGGVIFYTTLFNLFSKIGNLIKDNDFVKKYKIFENNLDFILFLPESASINNNSSRDINPPTFFVKDKSLWNLFLDKFSDRNYNVIYVPNN